MKENINAVTAVVSLHAGVFLGELKRLMIEKRTELTGSGRGRTVVVVVSDREACCDEPDYQEADCGGVRSFGMGRREERTDGTRMLVSEQ